MTGDDHVLARDLAGQAGTAAARTAGSGRRPGRAAQGRRPAVARVPRRRAGRPAPGDVVLSEEGADNPARLGARRVWIVDPLDGTREFGEPGRTDWAVHVALWESDASDLIAGAVALPAQGRVLSTAEPPPPLAADEAPAPHRGEPEQATSVRSEYFRAHRC